MNKYTFHIGNNNDVTIMANSAAEAEQVILSAWMDGKPLASPENIKLWHSEEV